MTLETIQVDSGVNPRHAVVWLHGLGADGHDFEPIVPELDLTLPVRFVFPHAPQRAVTINGGMIMRAWYDIDPGAPLAGEQDIEESSVEVSQIVSELVAADIQRENVVLAGFSQGGVIALHNAIRAEPRYAGVMALSTYVHDHENLSEVLTFASVDTPIFMAHGTIDPMIPITRAITSRVALTDLNYEVEWHQYGMGHAVCAEEIGHISDFLNRVLS